MLSSIGANNDVIRFDNLLAWLADDVSCPTATADSVPAPASHITTLPGCAESHHACSIALAPAIVTSVGEVEAAPHVASSVGITGSAEPLRYCLTPLDESNDVPSLDAPIIHPATFLEEAEMALRCSEKLFELADQHWLKLRHPPTGVTSFTKLKYWVEDVANRLGFLERAPNDAAVFAMMLTHSESGRVSLNEVELI